MAEADPQPSALSGGPRVPPVVLCVAAVVAQRVVTRSPQAGRRTGRVAGATVGLMSLGVLAASVATFRARETTVDPRCGAEPSALVTDGANAYTRNPMYAGMAGVQVAHALWLGRAASLLPLAAFVMWIDRVQITGEEKDLRETFAGSYDDYAARVPRWLGPRRPGA